MSVHGVEFLSHLSRSLSAITMDHSCCGAREVGMQEVKVHVGVDAVMPHSGSPEDPSLDSDLSTTETVLYVEGICCPSEVPLFTLIPVKTHVSTARRAI